MFIPDVDNLKASFNDLYGDFGKLLNIQYSGIDDLFTDSKQIEDVDGTLSFIPALSDVKVKYFDTTYLMQGIAYFRPYIRALIIMLLVFYNMKHGLSFIGQDAGMIAGLAKSSAGGAND